METNLTILPVLDPRLIPRYLIDQIKPKLFETDDWYKIMMHNREVRDDSNILLAIVNKDHKIKGVIWVVLDLLQKALFVNFLSVSKDLQGQGRVLDAVVPYLLKMAQDFTLKSVLWGTTRSRAYERYGFQKSKNILLEAKVEGFSYGKHRETKCEQRSSGDQGAKKSAESTDTEPKSTDPRWRAQPTSRGSVQNRGGRASKSRVQKRHSSSAS